MPVSTAVEAHAQRSANCAQAVLRGFQQMLAIPDERIAAASAHGGGRAPEGLCGALHSALELVDRPEDKAAIRAEFARQAGDVTCRAVRSLKQLSCSDCVRVAAYLVLVRTTPQ